MKLFMQYLRQKWRVLAAFTLFAAVLAVCFALYRLPLRAVWYPLALCAALGLSLLTADFLRLRRRHEALCRLRAAPDPAQLPSPAGICEEDYQTLVRALDERARRAETETDARMRAMIDYYTLWAHQIKTPISAMRLTLQSEDSDTARRLSSDLRRVEQYVEMVMVYLRLDSESTDFVIRTYDLDGIIRAAVRPFAGEFIGRRLQLHYEPLDYRAVTDEKWLGFVIGQVLSNALKYTSRGGITISMPSTASSASATRAWASRRRICRVSLSGDIPAATAAPTGAQAGSGSISAAACAMRSDTRSPRAPRRVRERRSASACAAAA